MFVIASADIRALMSHFLSIARTEPSDREALNLRNRKVPLFWALCYRAIRYD